MTTRTTVAIVVAGVAAAVVCWLSIRDPQPRYKGHSLSYWIDVYCGAGNQVQGEQAIQSIGTNGFPLLLRWIREPEPKRHPLIVRIAGMLPRAVRPNWAGPDYVPRAYAGAYTFQALGAQASPIVSELSMLAADPAKPDAAAAALRALAFMGSNGIPALLTALRDTSHPRRTTAALVLGEYSRSLGPYTNSVVAELLAQLDDPAVANWAAFALGRIKARPDLVVPALANHLEKTNTSSKSRIVAATALIWFGEQSVPALPHLTNALNDPDPIIRQNVAEAIKQIHYRIRKK